MITVAEELFANALMDLNPLFEANWKKLSFDKTVGPFAPNYIGYLHCEKSGVLRLLVARDEGEAVGYWLAFRLPSLQAGYRMRCVLDTFGVKEGYENKVPLPMMRAVERCNQEEWGAHDSLAGSRLHGAWAGRLYEAFGYTPLEIVYTKSYVAPTGAVDPSGAASRPETKQ